jgi:hypothetical protein
MAQQMLLPQTFFGFTAGQATANNSNFFGQGAGAGATVAQNSNFFGQVLGDATNATQSNFFGLNGSICNWCFILKFHWV